MGVFFSSNFWFWLAIAVLVVQLAVYPFTLPTHLDEGLYSFYGYNWIRGLYPMYEQGGPWFQHPPMAYIVPGIIHSLLGTNFYGVRIICALFGGLMVLVSYRTALKLGGTNAALICIWLLVGQAETIRYYCMGGPLPFVALCVGAAVLSLVSDIKSPLREVLAIFFVSIALMTRTNMCFTWAVVVLYAIVTQERWSHRLTSVLASILFPGIFVVVFWPHVLASALQHHLLPVFIREWFVPDPLVETAPRYHFPARVFVGSLYYFFRYYALILVSVGMAIIWVIVYRARFLDARKLWEHRGVVLIAVLFLGNFVAHVIGPMAIGLPYVMYTYFNYYAPMAALLGSLGLAAMIAGIGRDFSRGVVVGAMAISVLVSIFPHGGFSRWPISLTNTRLQAVESAARRLEQLTRPDDKIFALACMNEFLVADRRPYPAMLIMDAISLNKDQQKVTRFNRYNYELAESYLNQADVVIVSDYGELELAALYPGQPGAGRDVVDLIERVVAKDFTLVEEIPETSMGRWRIYRRSSPSEEKR